MCAVVDVVQVALPAIAIGAVRDGGSQRIERNGNPGISRAVCVVGEVGFGTKHAEEGVNEARALYIVARARTPLSMVLLRTFF